MSLICDTVRTPDGELTYNSFGEVERALLKGLVEPDDEIREEGSNQWRKASSLPLLGQARQRGDAVWGTTQPLDDRRRRRCEAGA